MVERNYYNLSGEVLEKFFGFILVGILKEPANTY